MTDFLSSAATELCCTSDKAALQRVDKTLLAPRSFLQCKEKPRSFLSHFGKCCPRGKATPGASAPALPLMNSTRCPCSIRKGCKKGEENRNFLRAWLTSLPLPWVAQAPWLSHPALGGAGAGWPKAPSRAQPAGVGCVTHHFLSYSFEFPFLTINRISANI